MARSDSCTRTAWDRQFKGVNWREGFDLNHDGTISPTEKIPDYNGNGEVGDPKDWERFLSSNAAALEHRLAFFRRAAPFKTDNPIHELASIEAEVVTPDEIEGIYDFVERVLSKVRWSLEEEVPRTNQEKLKLVYDHMMEVLAVHWLAPKVRERIWDSDISVFVMQAVAHEMGWPVSLVKAPLHLFLRWEDGNGERFNMDVGEIYGDDYYREQWAISDALIQGGIYLVSLSPLQVRAQFFHHNGIVQGKQGHYETALSNFDMAVSLDPKDVWGHVNLGITLAKLKRYQEAKRHFDQAILLDPEDGVAKQLRDWVERRRVRQQDCDYQFF